MWRIAAQVPVFSSADGHGGSICEESRGDKIEKTGKTLNKCPDRDLVHTLRGGMAVCLG